jgi:putative hemolysin
MRTIPVLLTISLGLMILLCGCTQAPAGGGTVTPAATTPASGIANPAATYCTQQPNTQYEIRKNADGSEYGVCILPNGVVCEEWAYYRHECPAAPKPPVMGVPTTSAGIANPSATFCVSKNYSYQIVTNPDGSQSGNCVFPSGKACDGWAYFRNECNETTAK